ncbi:MAG: cytochrome c-type biogenesis protein CcmH [Actinobacteria bacterium]|nr:cytochrome c-type biogenesis protein CcmH [Actinomycetota bacterium]
MRVLAVAVAALAFAGTAAAACPSAARLEGQLICPTCKTTLDQSDAPVAREIKAHVRRRVAACASEEQIKDELVVMFGPAVLAAPPKEGFHLLAWLLPLTGLAVGAAVVSLLVWRWSRGRPPDEPTSGSNGRAGLDPEVERRLDQELARFDG